MHTGVATSLTPFGDRRPHGRDCPALVLSDGAEHVPRIENPPGPTRAELF